jgi:hypothetical protein
MAESFFLYILKLILYIPVRVYIFFKYILGDKERGFNIPNNVIFVTGFLGYTTQELQVAPYWGQVEISQARGPKIGPVSTYHDRACEVFYGIKGGRINYHDFKHSQYGRLEKGIYPQWDDDHPIILVAHSAGCITVYELLKQLELGYYGPNNSPKCIEGVIVMSAPNGGVSWITGGRVSSSLKGFKYYNPLSWILFIIYLYDKYAPKFLKRYYDFYLYRFPSFADLNADNIGISLANYVSKDYTDRGYEIMAKYNIPYLRVVTHYSYPVNVFGTIYDFIKPDASIWLYFFSILGWIAGGNLGKHDGIVPIKSQIYIPQSEVDRIGHTHDLEEYNHQFFCKRCGIMSIELDHIDCISVFDRREKQARELWRQLITFCYKYSTSTDLILPRST